MVNFGAEVAFALVVVAQIAIAFHEQVFID